ncbi:sensor histidine kinase [Hydrogenophaga soli]
MRRRLYLSIWLAVVTALVVLSALAAWLWRLDAERQRAERPGREVIIYNAQGEVLGQAPARPLHAPGGGPLEFEVPLRDGQTLYVQLPRGRRAPPDEGGAPGPHAGPMHGGVAHPPSLDRPPGKPPGEAVGWRWPTVGFLGMLGVVAVAVALGTYPVVRWLTLRLERLQHGVERWGDGDLSVRLPVEGKDEVAFLAQRFNAAAERVQGLVQSHKTLLANASHELRSPLARIRMGLELLTSGDATQQATQRAEMARNIAELDQLIDEILLASRMDLADDGLLNWEDVDLTGLAAEECARVDVPLEVFAQPMVRGDARLLRRVLRNLLENACRYGRRSPSVDGGGVSLTLSEAHESGKTWAVVTVDDHGPGVPVAERERIFQPFYRVSGASERQGGVGLGLALVNSIAQRHQGRVVCAEAPGGGARFVVKLPLSMPTASPK